MRDFRLYPVFCMLALFAACTLFAQNTLYPNSLLWRISGKGLTKPSYLYGTMHLQDRRLFQFSDSLYYFLEHTDGYAMEIDPDETFAALMNSLAQPDTSGFLKDVMDEKDFKKIAGNLESQFGVPADKVTKKQAWLYKQGWRNKPKTKPDDMDAAMDMYLYNIAKRQGKWVGGIEDVSDQFDLLNGLGARFTGDDLQFGAKVEYAALEKLIKLYSAQDLNKLNEWCLSMDSVDLDSMLVKRNKKMAKRIDSLAHIRSSFFAVGAAHLPGSFGLIHLLQEAGYQVEAVLSRKKVAPEAYHYQQQELPWYPVENEEKTYEAAMPGKAIPFTPYEALIKMKVYADMGTGIFYCITGFQAPAGKNSDSVLAQMAKNYARAGNNVKPSKIVWNGRECLETTYNTNGYHYRMRLIADSGQVILMMTGSAKKELLYHKEVEKFYQSLKTNPASIAKKNNQWFPYVDEERGIGTSFPDKPSFNKDYHQSMIDKDSEGWEFTNQIYFDLLSQTWYMLTITEAKPGYYIINGQEHLSEMRTNMEHGGKVAVIKYETGEFNGYPCMWLDGRDIDNDMRLKIFSVVRGNRNFNLMTYADNNADSVSLNKFLSSFRFHDFKKQEWRKYPDSIKAFTTLAPAPAIKEINEDVSTGKTQNSIFYDKISGFSFQVNAEALSPYYWTTNDSTLFAENVAGILAEGDSILTSKKVRNGEAEGMEYLIRLRKDGGNLKRLRLLLNKDTVYSLFFVAPRQFHGIKEYNSFFGDFQFTQYRRNQEIFTNKTQKILEGINAADSATRDNAKFYIDKAPFTKADLPLLHRALLQPYADFEESWYSTHDRLLKKVVAFTDESTVDFIQQNYASLTGDKEELKYPLLKGLAEINTDKSYSVLKELLIKHSPVKGYPVGLGNTILNHKPLTKTLFPEILTLVSDSLFSGELATICNELLDSNFIQIEALRPYEASFLQQAKHCFDTIATRNSDYSWELYDWIFLLGKFNDTKSNQLLQQFAASHFPDVQYNAARELIKNNQVVPAAILEKIAADKGYRLMFYEECKKLNKLKLFPARYLNQKSIAESELYSYASDDVEPSKMEYIGERIAFFKRKKQKFYLFKITYSEDEPESYLGIAGPYSLTPGAIITEADALGMYYKATYYPKHVDEQFKEFLKEREEYAENKEEE